MLPSEGRRTLGLAVQTVTETQPLAMPAAATAATPSGPVPLQAEPNRLSLTTSAGIPMPLPFQVRSSLPVRADCCHVPPDQSHGVSSRKAAAAQLPSADACISGTSPSSSPSPSPSPTSVTFLPVRPDWKTCCRRAPDKRHEALDVPAAALCLPGADRRNCCVAASARSDDALNGERAAQS